MSTTDREDWTGVKITKTRRCASCGRPTADYRCPTCWERKRKKSGGSAETQQRTDGDYLYW